VAATTVTVSAAKSHDGHWQRRIEIGKIAFTVPWKYPSAEDGASFGKLINMPAAPLTPTHVPGKSGFEAARPICGSGVKITPGN